MSPHTAKTIKELVACLGHLYGGGGEMGVYAVAKEKDNLERLLYEFAENIRTDAIEP